MQKRFVLRGAVALLAAGVVLVAPALATEAKAEAFSAEGQKVVDYLLDDWQKRFRSTPIDWAISNLGMEADDDLRLEVGEHFRQNTELAKNLQWWGANNYLLSDDEKLIAKALVNTWAADERLPGREELAVMTGLSAEALTGRLAFMARAGLLVEASDGELGYALAEGHEQWGGPLRYNFHTVEIEGEKPFGLW